MKKITITTCMAMLSILLVTGCTGVKELHSSMNEVANSGTVGTSCLNIIKNKTTKSELLKSIGAPSMSFKNEIGGETWVYQRVAVRNSDLNVGGRADFAAVFPFKANTLSHGGGLAGVGAGSSVSESKSSYKTAGLVVNFNQNGCVDTYEYTATSF